MDPITWQVISQSTQQIKELVRAMEGDKTWDDELFGAAADKPPGKQLALPAPQKTEKESQPLELQLPAEQHVRNPHLTEL